MRKTEHAGIDVIFTRRGIETARRTPPISHPADTAEAQSADPLASLAARLGQAPRRSARVEGSAAGAGEASLGPAPCSVGQEWLWLLHRLDPSGAAAHRPTAYRVVGPLDVAVLTRCLTGLAARA